MKTVGYRNAWAFLDEYRGKEFEGEWPTVPQLLHISTMRFPDNLCFRAFNPDVQLTYTEVEAAVFRIARALVSDGFKKGDKIAVSGHNSAEWALSYFSIIKMGGIVVPLDPTLKDNEIERFISFGDVSGLFIDSERLERIDADGALGLRKYSIEEDVMRMDGPECAFPVLTGEDIAAILFTSGTTGTPKGVMLNHNNLVSDCFMSQSIIVFFPTDVIYAILPLHHSYTMMAVVYNAISSGGAVVFGKKLAMSHIFQELRDGKVTIFMAVPMLFNKMISSLMSGVRKKGIVVYGVIKALMGISGFVKNRLGKNIGKKLFGFLLEKLSFENVRLCISGGGPLPASTFRMFNELGLDFVQGYGLTEASPITHVNPVEAFRTESVGKQLFGEEVKIVDPDSDGNGLIFIKGPMVMQGYYKNREATEEVLSSDGWLNTGDVGHLDSDGYLYLTGRKKNVIVTDGGKNVFPEEVEDPFQLYDDIEQICVIGYISDKALKKEELMAIILPSKSCIERFADDRTRIEAHINSIVDSVNRDVPSYKRITRVEVVYESLPLTGTKKVKRGEVIEKYGNK